MFFKKQDEAKTGKDNKNLSTDNILEVFSKDMEKDKNKSMSDSSGKRDYVFYLDRVTYVIKLVTFIFGLVVLSTWGYNSVQNNVDFKNLSYLKPVCGYFLGEVGENYDGCESLESANQKYSEKLSSVELGQTKAILEILPDVYSLDNFLFTSDISFLINKTSQKLEVTKILADFNKLKEAFDTKKDIYKVVCDDLNINNNFEVIMECTSYTSDWSEENIVGFKGQVTSSNKISGTSITVAASFINYLKNKGENFKVAEHTKVFSYSESSEEGNERYTKKTDFSLTLKYNKILSK